MSTLPAPPTATLAPCAAPPSQAERAVRDAPPPARRRTPRFARQRAGPRSRPASRPAACDAGRATRASAPPPRPGPRLFDASWTRPPVAAAGPPDRRHHRPQTDPRPRRRRARTRRPPRLPAPARRHGNRDRPATRHDAAREPALCRGGAIRAQPRLPAGHHAAWAIRTPDQFRCGTGRARPSPRRGPTRPALPGRSRHGGRSAPILGPAQPPRSRAAR